MKPRACLGITGRRLLRRRFGWGDIPVATLRPSGSSVAVYYVHSDHLNTPRQVTRASDTTQMWTWFSEPFGNTNTNVTGYFERLKARPSIARVIKQAGPYFSMVPKEGA